MLEDNRQNNNVYNANDTLDINELASLNDDITPEFIEQLQNQVSKNADEFTGKTSNEQDDDTELFEEIDASPIANTQENKEALSKPTMDDSIDDNFIKKYKAKLNKQKNGESSLEESQPSVQINMPELNDNTETPNEVSADDSNNEISTLTGGNITEKPLSKEQANYNDSLDFLDDNIKYSKYVIYINPENKEFIDSLTVKERKNIINRILREQDDIAITKKRLNLIQTVIKHSVVAIVTIALAIPIVYWTINASLEASINNYRRSQNIFKTLYREKGKIRTHTNIN